MSRMHPTKRPSRRRSCTGKVKYSTLRHAQEAIAVVVPREKRGQFSAYQCSWCGMHHWGHTPFWKRKESA